MERPAEDGTMTKPYLCSYNGEIMTLQICKLVNMMGYTEGVCARESVSGAIVPFYDKATLSIILGRMKRMRELDSLWEDAVELYPDIGEDIRLLRT